MQKVFDDGGRPPSTGNAELRLTYALIAARLGISGDAARQLVRRRGWQRIKPNRMGAPAIILVPEDEISGEEWRADRPTPPDNRATPPVNPLTPPDNISRMVSGFEAAIASLTERATAAETRADAERSRAERAEQALAAERSRGDALRDRLDGADQARRQAEEATEGLRRAEVERQARGRLRRAWDGWRGR